MSLRKNFTPEALRYGSHSFYPAKSPYPLELRPQLSMIFYSSAIAFYMLCFLDIKLRKFVIVNFEGHLIGLCDIYFSILLFYRVSFARYYHIFYEISVYLTANDLNSPSLRILLPVLLLSDRVERQNFIDCLYSNLVDILKHSAELHVPLRYKSYYKFWWSEELSCLKDNAIKSNNIWKDAGQPRSGPIADLRNIYKKMLYSEKQAETRYYTNDLHDALMTKSGDRFWKCWNSKFERGSNLANLLMVLLANVKIAEAFAEHFSKTCTSFNENQNNRLQSIYHDMRLNYVVELIECVSSKMKSKAAGLDELTIEHVICSHPVLFVILSKLFNLIMSGSYVPHGFRLSYTVPRPKEDNFRKRNTVDNYRQG